MGDIAARYAELCVACHGPEGKGDGPIAASLPDPKPADLSKTQLDDAGLKAIIKEGGEKVGRSPIMAAFGATLSAAQIDEMVAHIRSFQTSAVFKNK